MRHALLVAVLLVAIVLVASCGTGGGGGSAAPTGLGQLVRVDRLANGTGGSEDGMSAKVSADGRYVVFASESGDLLPIDPGSGTDIFRKDLRTGELVLVSKAWGTAGRPPANGSSVSPSMSADGSVIAFVSNATNLVPAAATATPQVYVADLAAGTVTRASVRSDGTQAGAASDFPAVSGNGRYVVFSSTATNLDSAVADTNGSIDVFRHDRVTGATIRVSVDQGGAERIGHSIAPSVSHDGSRIVFDSVATLTVDDTNAVRDVYLRDLALPFTRCLSIDEFSLGDADTIGNGASTFPSISGDGRWVCFLSSASDLVAGDFNGRGDLFLRDLTAETTTRVALGDGVAPAEADQAPSPIGRVSDGGRYVVFGSAATNLVAGDTNGLTDVFVQDRTMGRTRRVSVAPGGVQNTGSAGVPAISANGAVVVFHATGDLPGAHPTVEHVFATPVVPTSGG